MSIGKDAAVRRRLRTLFDLGAVGELTDGQLLERFAVERSEAAELAFAALVERHGPMVLRVCRGVLGDVHEAQDAFQATFLVLVKRARRLWVRESLGPWLHQVAYRTASCARATAARHRRLERRAALRGQESPPERDFELERLLHAEIERLPERYRAPVVLCDLEGRTHEQAARHLGWPVGTVKSRLSRARERLRARLVRRGLGAEAGPLAVAGVLKSSSLTIPPTLLDATTTAAVQFAAVGSVARGTAVLLAEGVLQTMSMMQWWKVVTVLLVAGATASGVEWLGGGIGPGTQAPEVKQDPDVRTGDAPTQEVKPGKLRLTLKQRGYVEAARTEGVYSRVEGGTTIIRIVPEGSAVKKGEVIVELDSAALKDQLINQRITVKSAEANFLNARLTREVAEIAVAEYEEVYRQNDEALKGAIEGTRAAIRKTQERLERTRAARERLAEMLRASGGARTPADAVAEVDLQDRIEEAELTLDRERRSLAKAEGKREVLRKYTYPKTLKELQSEVKKAHSDELAKEATWELEKGKEDKLEKQIRNCTLIAPVNGTILYANDPRRPGFGNRTQIEEGATVRERQKIVSIVDFNDPMQVNIKVPEALIDHVVPQMKAQIRIDAFPGQTFAGLVTEVAPLPDAGNSFSSDIKVYTTRIRLSCGRPQIRPGMTADAVIVLDDREDAIGVPAKAVARYDGKDHVAVKWPGGRIEWREVVLGPSDGSVVEVKEGLHSGEQVVLDAEPLLTDEQRARRDAVIEPAYPKARPAVPRKGKAGGRVKG